MLNRLYLRSSFVAFAALLPLVGCSGDDTAPQIDAFTASSTSVALGQTVTLGWKVRDAATITIHDGSGAELVSTTEGEGEATISPTATRTYTLKAVGEGGTTTRELSVVVTGGFAIRSFAAEPETIDSGAASTLRWQVDGDPASVEISAGGTTIVRGTDASGSRTVTPTMSTTYTLTAQKGDQVLTKTARVNVRAGDALEIVGFDYVPAQVAIGQVATLRWTVRNAARVVLSLTEPASAEVYNSVTDGVRSEINIEVVAPRMVFQLTASRDGQRVQETLVVDAIGPVEITNFAVTPRYFTEASTTATARWQTQYADAAVLTINGQVVQDFPATPEAGEYSFEVAEPSLVIFVASNRLGPQISFAEVVPMTAVDPTESGTVALPGDGTAVLAALGEPSEVDAFELTVVEGGSMTVTLDGPTGRCDVRGTLEVYTSTGALVGRSVTRSPFECASISRVEAAFARNMAADRYTIKVSADQVGPYILRTSSFEPACGNSLIETRVGESCDDGNTMDGDSCSATCTQQFVGTAMGPGGSTRFEGAIVPGTRVDYYRIEMIAPGSIRAEAFAPEAPDCESDLEMDLLTAEGDLLASGGDRGTQRCPLIDPAVLGGASVDAGSYVLRVYTFGEETAPRYALEIETFVPSCGNDVVEGGEECDDGNQRDGDGCDAMCRFEGASDIEPNNTSSTAIALIEPFGLPRGAINPIGDVDVYAVDVPEGHHLTALLTVNSAATCRTPAPRPTGHLELLDSNGEVLVPAAGRDFTTNCAEISPLRDPQAAEMPAGRYYLRVSESRNDAAIDTYFLHVQIDAPVCGNGLVETSAGEQCEPAINDHFGRACSTNCRLEPAAVIRPPSQAVVLDLPAFASSEFLAIVVETDGQSISVSTEDVGGTDCEVDTAIELFDPDLESLGAAEEDGARACGRIDPRLQSYARDLAAGTYYLLVLNTGVRGGETRVDVGVIDPECGNGLLEVRAGEFCEDTNTAAGDGCSPSCQPETSATYTAPGAAATFSGSILDVGGRNYFRIDVLQQAYLTVSTFSDAASESCVDVDTVLRLFDGESLLAFDREDGVGACAQLDFARDAALKLDPGTYWAMVSEENADDAIVSYDVVFTSTAAGICGNGVSEGEEACDDGNRADGDGCSAACENETPTPVIAEVEPNDESVDATETGLGLGTVILEGTLPQTAGAAGADTDRWAVDVPAGVDYFLSVAVEDPTGGANGCEDSIYLFLDTPAQDGGTPTARGDGAQCPAAEGQRLVGGAQGQRYLLRIQHPLPLFGHPEIPYRATVTIRETM